MPIDDEVQTAIKTAVRDEIARQGLVERKHHDGHAGHVASKMQTLERLIAMKSGGSGGVNTHEVVHSIIDQRLADFPAITHQLPPDVPTRSEVRELVAKAVQALPRPPPPSLQSHLASANSGLSEFEVNRLIDAAITGLQAYIQAMAQQTLLEAQDTVRQMYQSIARVETATLALDAENLVARRMMQSEADAAGLPLDEYIANVHAQHDAMKAAALSTGNHS